jgi:DMSO/TMAO reductase YedYZ molybdopterin-dependent catalytic subunit
LVKVKKAMIKLFKVLGFILIVAFMASVIISCQPATTVQEPPPESNATVMPSSIPPNEDNSFENSSPMPTTRYSGNYTLPLTPIEELGITGVAQNVDIEKYRLIINGLVENPLSLTYQQILEYPPVTEIGVIDCPGYFLDIAEWTGVPLSTILAEAGIKPHATKLTFYSLDGYKQTLTLEHVSKYGIFLAYIVNEETLPREHGYPLRVVDNGSTGSAWVKWVETITVE